MDDRMRRGLDGWGPAAALALAVAATVPVAAAAQRPGPGPEWSTDFSKHTVPLDEIVPGGPPKDGIPALDNPRFETVAQADGWLRDREPVVAFIHDGDARAYPYRIMIQHEIVNDVVGGLPVAITFCPLCNTALAFDRRHEGRVLDFGTTGWLRNSDLVMYDRQTESWWQQASGEAIVGELAGAELPFLAAQTVSWANFREAYPTGRVLSRETGFARDYGRNPYVGYDDLEEGRPWARFFRRDTDDRLRPMERVVAVTLGERPLAFPFAVMAEERVAQVRIADRPVVVLWAPGTASALDAPRVADGREVGASGVFDRRLGDRTLTFAPDGDGSFRDRETGSRWNILGQALAGPLAGEALEPLPHGDYFWFAWAAFRPDTRVWRP
jgi:hypothetical protein